MGQTAGHHAKGSSAISYCSDGPSPPTASVGAKRVAVVEPLVTAAAMEGPARPPGFTKPRRTVRLRASMAEIILG